ncbi:MAG: hypothetical protein P8I83_07810 [Paracoccaceae bacterium]|nr:hypothetical protein [Paracoccaceae bacterium]
MKVTLLFADLSRAKCHSALLYKRSERKFVLALNHGDRTNIARPTGQWLAAAPKNFIENGPMVTCVPLHWQRRMTRHYNQAALVAHILACKASLNLIDGMLSFATQTLISTGCKSVNVTVLARSIHEH